MQVGSENTVVDNYRQIYVEYAPVLLHFAQKFVSDFCAEDIVHDVFLKFWDKRIFLLPKEELKPLLYSSVRNSCIDYLRRQKLDQNFADQNALQLKLDELYYFEKAESLFMQKDFLQCVSQKINDLPPRMQEIFHLSYVLGLKNPEIAEQLGISTRTVENQLYRILLFLKKHFKNQSSFFSFFLLFL